MTICYLAAAYSQVENKEELMRNVMRFAGQFMINHPGHHVVSPLFFHYGLPVNPEMGTDYAFWGEYSRALLSKADMLIVYRAPGTDIDKSTGVQDEIETARKLGLRIHFTSRPD